ncbi:MAG: response regulator [Candidatus Omnitrophica bacterium]|nr:response regulator [Candidatus Omnitrophota bacterium]
MAICNEKKTILLVEDEADLLTVVKFRLKSYGYNVVTAGDGIQALEKLKEIKPDLIVLDINLPNMGGIEFYRKISTPYGHSKYRVLILTARANLEKIFRDIEVDGFMAKPFEIDRLIEEIERIINKKDDATIFLVDYPENPYVKEIADYLRVERYNVLFCDSFSDLKEKAEEVKPAVIIMEYMNKEMSGEAFIRRIKGDPLLHEVPLVVYSYSDFKELEEKSVQAGADKYLGKPSGCSVFMKAIKELKLKA